MHCCCKHGVVVERWCTLQVASHGTLDPATHAYAFWEGMPIKARMAFGQLFAKSSTLQCVAIVQRAIRKDTPQALMASYGFGDLALVDTVKGVHMSGALTRLVLQTERSKLRSGHCVCH